MRWLAILGAGLIAQAPLVSFADGDTSDAAAPPTDCTLVGMHFLTDDLNAVHQICRHADGSTTVGPVQAVPASTPADTEAPTQYFPLDESSAG